HALEKLLAKDISHEYLSSLFMNRLNVEFSGRLTEAISIFTDTHPKKFLHQLVSSQLDVDRLDYLNRDSFFTGVSEGVISSDRIIKMLDIADGNLVIEEKGIYSVEKFITARRLMYWQVYLHKTVLAAEHMLINIIERARELAAEGVPLFGTESFLEFLVNEYSTSDFSENDRLLEKFASLDDFDVFTSIKVWCNHPDKVLSTLCKGLTNRKLYKIEISRDPFTVDVLQKRQIESCLIAGVPLEQSRYLAFEGSIENNAYDADDNKINILFKNGVYQDIAKASDNFNIDALTKPVKKYFLCSLKSNG
nr:phosphohydrolase [Bacteroidia bacterium]